MKKRIISLLLVICLATCMLPAVASADFIPEHTEHAYALYDLGLFKGMGTNADGTPDFALDNDITRAQSLVMLIRLLGEEDDALEFSKATPFTDINKHWAQSYIEYAYYKGYTNGMSATTFVPDDPANANMYLTFLLRALGYNDKIGDFSYDTAYLKAAEKHLCGEYEYIYNTPFFRDDCVYTSYNALFALMKDSNKALLTALVNSGAVNSEKVSLFYLDKRPFYDERFLDFGILYHVGSTLEQLKTLYPNGAYSEDVGFICSTVEGDEYSQVIFKFENGSSKPCTSVEGTLKNLLASNASQNISATDLANAVSGTVSANSIVSEFAKSSIVIYKNNGTYNGDSAFIYENRSYSEPEDTKLDLSGVWTCRDDYHEVFFDITDNGDNTLDIDLFDEQVGGTRFVEYHDVSFTSTDGITYVSEIIQDSYEWLWQFSIVVDDSLGSDLYNAKLICSMECIASNAYLQPNYSFPSDFIMSYYF